MVKLENNVLLHVLHVNTVGNQKFSATVVSKRLRRYAQILSNATKTKRILIIKKMIIAHEAYLREESKVNARVELIATVDNHIKQNPECCPPQGFPSFENIDFNELGYSETLCLALSKSLCSTDIPSSL